MHLPLRPAPPRPAGNGAFTLIARISLLSIVSDFFRELPVATLGNLPSSVSLGCDLGAVLGYVVDGVDDSFSGASEKLEVSWGVRRISQHSLDFSSFIRLHSFINTLHKVRIVKSSFTA